MSECGRDEVTHGEGCCPPVPPVLSVAWYGEGGRVQSRPATEAEAAEILASCCGAPIVPTHVTITHPDGRTEIVRLEDVQVVPEHLLAEVPPS